MTRHQTALETLTALAREIVERASEVTVLDAAHYALLAKDGLALLEPRARPAHPAGTELIRDVPCLMNGKGQWTPLDTIKPLDLLEHETVDHIFGHAVDLSAQVTRFRKHTLDDIGNLLALMDQEYGAAPGGEKGNMTFVSFDQLRKITVKIAQLFEFGPQLQSAKLLVDECLREWGETAPRQLQAVMQHAFAVDSAGRVNRSGLLQLLRLRVEDERWERAMKAVVDAMRPMGTKEYINFYRRDDRKARWEHVSIDMAAA